MSGHVCKFHQNDKIEQFISLCKDIQALLHTVINCQYNDDHVQTELFGCLEKYNTVTMTSMRSIMTDVVSVIHRPIVGHNDDDYDYHSDDCYDSDNNLDCYNPSHRL
jgi:hypothetical protein